jgi:hypothetical protein
MIAIQISGRQSVVFLLLEDVAEAVGTGDGGGQGFSQVVFALIIIPAGFDESHVIWISDQGHNPGPRLFTTAIDMPPK